MKTTRRRARRLTLESLYEYDVAEHPALEVLASDLTEEGYVDVVWQISASHPGLLIDSFVLYRGYSIDPSVSKFAQKEPFDALPLSKLLE